VPEFRTACTSAIAVAAVVTDALNKFAPLLNASGSAFNAPDSDWMLDCAWIVAPETDEETEPSAELRSVASELNAVISDESASERDAAAELRALESADTELLRALISVEIPVPRAASAAPNDAVAVLVAWDREETADPRPLTSELNAVLNDESTSARDAAARLRVPESADAALLRALISVLRPVLRAASAVPNDAVAVLVAWCREETADARPLTSELNAVLNDESASVRDAAARLRVPESADAALMRAPVSATREANNTAFPLITVDANEGSASIAVVTSSSVLSVELMSPAIAATLVLTYASVAMAVALYLGWFVKSH
jgi:ElaB/YqjD/DUF883 family membrane-anchored ribosome-binding protein